MAASSNLYQTLQLDPRAEDIVIQAAYRALMKRHHPDRGGSGARAQRLNAAYATLNNPVARRAYDLLRAAEPSWDELRDRGRSVTIEAEPAAGSAALVARLRPALNERFTPAEGDGPAWLFDFAGRPPEAPRERVLIKGCERGDPGDARGFQMRIEAARLIEPFWRRGPELFVAVVPRLSSAFSALLRAPRGPLARLSYAVVLVDLSDRTIHAVGGTAGLRSLDALGAVIAAPRAASA